MPQTITVADFPDQTGNTEAVARSNLLAVSADVLIAVVYEESAAPVGEVVSQDNTAIAIEEAGGPVGSHGVQITLHVSEVVSVVPDIVGQSVTAGKSLLHAAQLIGGTITFVVDPDNVYVITAQDPPPNDEVLPGSAVNYTVNVAGVVVLASSRGSRRRH